MRERCEVPAADPRTFALFTLAAHVEGRDFQLPDPDSKLWRVEARNHYTAVMKSPSVTYYPSMINKQPHYLSLSLFVAIFLPHRAQSSFQHYNHHQGNIDKIYQTSTDSIHFSIQNLWLAL